LGLAPDRLFDKSLEEQPVKLEAGDVLVLYSDGLTEAMDGSRDFYGEDRLYHALARHADLDAPGLLEALLEDVRRFTGGQPAHDDLTLLVLKRRNGAEQRDQAAQ
jgi:phosphoserine phosphatase RsbU/P